MENKILPEYPDYIIYSNGTVFSLKSEKYIKRTGDKRTGYAVHLYNSNGKKDFALAKLVAKLFLKDINTKHIRYLDGDKNNCDVSNLEYCKFSDLLNREKPRKKFEYRIPANVIVECYKHYFPHVAAKNMRKFILSNQPLCEGIVFLERMGDKRKHNIEHQVFKDYTKEWHYSDIQKAHNLSKHYVSEAIHNTRSELIQGIQKDIANNILRYVPLNKKQTYLNACIEHFGFKIYRRAAKLLE